MTQVTSYRWQDDVGLMPSAAHMQAHGVLAPTRSSRMTGHLTSSDFAVGVMAHSPGMSIVC